MMNGVVMLKLSGAKVKVSDVFCDRLSFVVNYVGPQQETVAANLFEMLKALKHYKTRAGFYKHAYQFWVSEDPYSTYMHVSWCPTMPGMSFLRVEINPSKIDLNHFAAVMESLLPGGMSDIHSKAKVTRVDAALDVVGVKPHQLFAFHPRKKSVQGYWKSRLLETLYLGGADSGRQIVIYDKNLQLEECKDKYHPWEKFDKSKASTTRIEVRLRPDVAFSALKQMKNPFEELILRLNSPALCKEEAWSVLHLASNICGHQELMQALPLVTKKKYLALYSALPAEWWSPSSVWGGWSVAVDGIIPKGLQQAIIN